MHPVRLLPRKTPFHHKFLPPVTPSPALAEGHRRRRYLWERGMGGRFEAVHCQDHEPPEGGF